MSAGGPDARASSGAGWMNLIIAPPGWSGPEIQGRWEVRRAVRDRTGVRHRGRSLFVVVIVARYRRDEDGAVDERTVAVTHPLPRELADAIAAVGEGAHLREELTGANAAIDELASVRAHLQEARERLAELEDAQRLRDAQVDALVRGTLAEREAGDGR